jgi:nitric-oxide synthase
MAIQIEALLHAAGLLQGLDERAANALLGRIAVQTYEPGAFLVTEGEIGDAAFVLLAGSLQVLGSRPDGSWIPLSRLEPGTLFGEQALLGRAGGRRAATVRAIAEVTVARLGAREFHEALPPDHPLRKRLVRLGKEQLRDRLALQSSVFSALRLPEAGDETAGLGAELQTFERGQALYYQGGPPEAVYVVVSGTAGVYVEKNGQQQLIARAEAGQCLGERGLLGRMPHATTVIAEDTVNAFRIPSEQFLELHASSPELRGYLASLQSVYQLPRRGFVTQFAGRFHDRECITSVYHLTGGRRAVASHVPGEEITNLVVHVAGDDDVFARATTHRFEDVERQLEREITVSPAGVLLSLTARGEWADLPELFVVALDGGTLAPWQCAAFAETGSIALEAPPTFNADEDVVCTCMQVRRREVRRAILAGCNNVEAIRKRCRAGGACGACKPRLLEMLGKSAWTPVRVASATDVAAGIRAFRLVPLKGKARPAQPGQHVVLQAQIDGRWIERPYTLSAPTTDGSYEITMQRVPGGLFSSWFFDRRGAEALLRVSEPQGDFTAPPGPVPVVYLVAGIGVTPAIAACRALVASGESRRVHIEYSARKPEVCAYAAEIEGASVRSVRLTANVRYTEASGRLGADGVAAIVGTSPGADYFLCGPATYLAAIRGLLVEKGVAAERIHVEEFVSAGEGVPPPSVRLSLSMLPGAPSSLRGGPASWHLPAPSSGRLSPLPPSGRTTLLPPTTKRAAPPPPGGPLPSVGICPVAHGTHRDDGIGLVPPITAGLATSVADEARAYLAQFYREKGAPKAFAARWSQVVAEIQRTGTYAHTYDELSFGAKLAWRNTTRCIGRLFWNGLQVRDLRHVTTEEEMLSALIEHIDLATNGGNLRALMTVFAPAGKGGHGPRIWNSQLLRYAGYHQADGSITGDPANAALTDQALKLGWKGGPRTRFDLLPLIVQQPGRPPVWQEIPRSVVREVRITHPDYPFFVDLGLKWYALPAVSDVLLDLGGVKYTAAPFNGWYMATEIGARNFSDPHRYNLLPEIAERLGLDTRRAATLWKDRAQIELTRAVIHSYERAGVKLVDHHTASDDFLQFIEAEKASERCVHMRWSWITPPIGGSSTPVFHLDQDHFADEPLKPNFFYQASAFADAPPSSG